MSSTLRRRVITCCHFEGCEQLCSRKEVRANEDGEEWYCQCWRKPEMSEQREIRCRECWWAGLDKQCFDGVVIGKRNKVQRLLILEFKRRTDTREEY
jgi:hypothetical protein